MYVHCMYLNIQTHFNFCKFKINHTILTFIYKIIYFMKNVFYDMNENITVTKKIG